ncbi:MAG: phosphoribosylglycinamide formyltransferase 2, partial [Wenzhouxiangella sp.]
LHARAILGLPIPAIRQRGPCASAALVVTGVSDQVSFGNLASALALPDTDLRLFGKPVVKGQRRMGVGLAKADSIDQARKNAVRVVETIEVRLGP